MQRAKKFDRRVNPFKCERKYVIKKCLNSAVKTIQKNKVKKYVFVEKKLNL
jgi:hypothetical protein